jgi:ADP-sugar diphosphatase
MAMTELPAGMIDDGTFAGAAAKEIHEELGLEIEENAMTDLTASAISSSDIGSPGQVEGLQRGVYPSPGGSDEYIPLFLYEKKVERKDLEGWEGKLTGLRDQGEKITLRVVRLEDLWRVGARDAKVLSAWALYKGLKDGGRL